MRTDRRIIRSALLAVTVCILAGIAGCYDDTALWKRLEGQESRLWAIEQTCEQINTNIASLQAILIALQENDYISSVAPIKEAGETIGYNLSFVKRGTVTIYNGEDGADGKDGTDGADGADGIDGRDGVDGRNGTDGSVPVVSARQDSVGCWYWTLNGEWLLDANGDRVKAVGTDGHDGKIAQDTTGASVGITPQLKIEEGYWFLSLDGGATWTNIGKATGDDGRDGFDGLDGTDGYNGRNGKNGRNGTNGKNGTNGDTIFKSIVVSAGNVVITMSDNTVITLPMENPLSISFSTENGLVADTLLIPDRTTIAINYVVTSSTEAQVAVLTTGSNNENTFFPEAYVEPNPENPLEGVIVLKVDNIGIIDLDNNIGYPKVLVIVTNETSSIIHTLCIQKAIVTIRAEYVEEENVSLTEAGGEINLHYQTNTPVTISIPDEAKSWCWQVKTKVAMADSVLTLHIEPNTGSKLRTTTVTVSNKFGTGTYKEVPCNIIQDCNSEPIVFADPNLKEALLNSIFVNFNSDNNVTKGEAMSVSSLSKLFEVLKDVTTYTSFNEFQYFTGIKDNDGDDALPDGSFNHWTNLQEITLPESLTSIKSIQGNASGVLMDCPKLTTIKGKFSVDNRALVLNNKDGNFLLAVATGNSTSYSIPDGVTAIASRSVYGVKELGVSASVTKILDSGFEVSQSDQDTVRVYFQGVTPPECGSKPLGDNKCDHIKIYVPAVITGGSVDKTATDARIEEFKKAFGNDAAVMKFASYTDWPF